LAVSLSPELRRRIFEEERFRAEARERAREEIRLRGQNVALALRITAMVVLFAAGYVVSNTYLIRGQTVPEAGALPAESSRLVTAEVLIEIERTLPPKSPAVVCVRAVGRGQPQIRATIELARDTTRDAARRLAVAKAREVGAALRGHGLALPAYVEVVSPGRWYGMAVYDRDTLRVTWDACPGRCEQEGSASVRRCTARPADTAAPNAVHPRLSSPGRGR
jgi:hypothetical protein